MYIYIYIHTVYTFYVYTTPLKTKMTLENPQFQKEIHLQIVDFPASHVSFRREYI